MTLSRYSTNDKLSMQFLVDGAAEMVQTIAKGVPGGKVEKRKVKVPVFGREMDVQAFKVSRGGKVLRAGAVLVAPAGKPGDVMQYLCVKSPKRAFELCPAVIEEALSKGVPH